MTFIKKSNYNSQGGDNNSPEPPCLPKWRGYNYDQRSFLFAPGFATHFCSYPKNIFSGLQWRNKFCFELVLWILWQIYPIHIQAIYLPCKSCISFIPKLMQ